MKQQCGKPGCTNPRQGRAELCFGHLSAVTRRRKARRKRCRQCKGPYYSKGLCRPHYNQQWRRKQGVSFRAHEAKRARATRRRRAAQQLAVVMEYARRKPFFTSSELARKLSVSEYRARGLLGYLLERGELRCCKATNWPYQYVYSRKGMAEIRLYLKQQQRKRAKRVSVGKVKKLLYNKYYWSGLTWDDFAAELGFESGNRLRTLLYQKVADKEKVTALLESLVGLEQPVGPVKQPRGRNHRAKGIAA